MYISEVHVLLSNFGLVLFLLALVLSLVDWLLLKTHRHSNVYEIFYCWMALLPLGVTGIYAFIMHAFFGQFTATTIGWLNSPFQYEVAMANLGFGVIAILSFNATLGFKKATVIANVCWLWGDGVGHIYQMIVHHNFTVGNAGSWLWLDLFLPLVLIVCIVKLSSKEYRWHRR